MWRPKTWIPASADDMKKFLYCKIMFGIHKLPSIEDYLLVDRPPSRLWEGFVCDEKNHTSISAGFFIWITTLTRNIVMKTVTTQSSKFSRSSTPSSRTLETNSCLPKIFLLMRQWFHSLADCCSSSIYIQGKANTVGHQDLVRSWQRYRISTWQTLTSTRERGNVLKMDLDMTLWWGLVHHTLGCTIIFLKWQILFFDQTCWRLVDAEDYSCSTIRTNRKEWPKNFSKKRHPEDAANW